MYRSTVAGMQCEALTDASWRWSATEAQLLLFGVGWCVWIADVTATVCVERGCSTCVLCEDRRHAHGSHARPIPPWTSLAESSRENSVTAVCSGASLSSWHGATIPGWVTAFNHQCWRLSPLQIGHYAYSRRTVNSPVHLTTGHFQWLLLVPGTACHIGPIAPTIFIFM